MPEHPVVKKNTLALEKADVCGLWASSMGVLTQEEFCGTLTISRTSLWRYARGGQEQSAGSRTADLEKQTEADLGWQEAARKLCEEFVTYGYRRICVLLGRAGHRVGKHRLRRWLREVGLAQSGPVRDTGRTPGERPPEPEKPNEAWQIDATKVHTDLDGWAWQTSVLYWTFLIEGSWGTW